MTFGEFIISCKQTFPPYCKTTEELDIYQYTEYLLDKLINILNQVSDSEYRQISTEKLLVVYEINRQKGEILSAINSFNNGNIAKCYETIFKEYFWNNDFVKTIFYKTIPAYKRLFRLRFNDSNRLLKPHEMFNIPFDKTDLVNNQRFSIMGHPCLYLGNSCYVCWEELGKPDLAKCNFAMYRNERQINMFDLSFPIEIKIIADILRLPLIISCAIKITHQNTPFKPEYLIPQSVLQGVARLNNNKMAQIHFDGIIYLSTRIGENILFQDENQIFNYVFPTIDRSRGKLCSQLIEMFTISNPIRYQEILPKYDVSDYKSSVFHSIEEYLLQNIVPKSKIENY